MKKWITFSMTLFWSMSSFAQANLDYSIQAEFLPQQTKTAPFVEHTPLSLRTFIPPELADTLQGVLEHQQDFLNMKGVNAALRLPTGAIWAGSAGISEDGPDGAMTPDHRSSIGSISKTIIAGVILDLYQEGTLDLEETIGDWGIDFQYVNPDITIRQLLRHQSGVFNFTNHPNFSSTMSTMPNIQYTPTAVLLQFLAPPISSPGEGFSYSNSNYLLLALIIEAATGNAYHEEVRSRFLDPLGLETFFLPVTEPLQSPIAHLWLDLNGNGQLVDYHNEFITWDAVLTATAAAGGYFATSTDLVKWIYHSQSGSLFEEATIQEMHSFISTTFPGNTTYGLGISKRNFVGYDGYGHGGDLSYAASAYHFPELEVSVSILDNDGLIVSWDHAPIISRLLNAYNWWAENFPTGVGAKSQTTVQIFPNPVTSWLDLSGNDVLENVSIFNAQGQIIFQQKQLTLPAQINCEAFPTGMYWVRWEEVADSYTKTFVKH